MYPPKWNELMKQINLYKLKLLDIFYPKKEHQIFKLVCLKELSIQDY